MRATITPSEAALWPVLSGIKLGITFRRQCVIVRFIADFAAPSIKLVVKTDGGYHARRAFADAARDRKLQRLGWRVLRLPATLLLADLALVTAVVRKHIGKLHLQNLAR
jgi:very-short-patch-repair endonuclease